MLLAFATLMATSSTSVPLIGTFAYSKYSLSIFLSPINISYNAQPYWSANMTFGLAKANVPSCDNSTTSGWFSGINSDGQCAIEAATEPVFRFARIKYFP